MDRRRGRGDAVADSTPASVPDPTRYLSGPAGEATATHRMVPDYLRCGRSKLRRGQRQQALDYGEERGPRPRFFSLYKLGKQTRQRRVN